MCLSREMFIFFTFLLEYNCFTMLLVSAVQQSESAIRIHISPYALPLEPPSHPSYPIPLGPHKVLSWSLCYAAAYHEPSILHLVVYICQCYSLALSQLPLPPLCPQVCSLCLRLYSCHATRFISTFFLESIYMC